jgi:formylglycine-generating enzyme required for sulfatase activity
VNRLVLVGLVACSSGIPVNHPGGANAQLSLAADAQMVTIPAGKFIAGSTPEERTSAYDDYQTASGRDTAKANRWFDGEEERHLITLPAFRIDLMPVTQAEYAEYVLAGKAPAPSIDEATWSTLGFSQDYATQVARFNWANNQPPAGREDHPVVLVTWTQANAYCKWRGELAGEPRRLPTAAEFEKAARGDAGLAYPWGNNFEADKLDSAVGDAKDTVPVGQFPKGASQYGVLGMAGNVFQWTSTPFSEGKMTVKGSAWDDYPGVGRGASRHGRPIETHHVIIGFRCAADVPAP